MFSKPLPSQSRRDREEGGELDSHEEVKRFWGSRRDQEVGGELDTHEEVKRFWGSRRGQDEGWWCWTFKLAQKRSGVGRWSWA